MIGRRDPAASARPRRRRGRSVLLLIAVFLIGSGLMRLVDGTGLALARELAARAYAAPPSAGDAAGPEVEALLAALRAREARLEKAEETLAERERALAVGQDELRRSLADLATAEASLRDLVATADGAAEQDIARLTAVYEAMKPAEAAKLFDQMEPRFAAGFLGRMRSDAAAAIMAGLPPDKAYALSVVLAGRNAMITRE